MKLSIHNIIKVKMEGRDIIGRIYHLENGKAYMVGYSPETMNVGPYDFKVSEHEVSRSRIMGSLSERIAACAKIYREKHLAQMEYEAAQERYYEAMHRTSRELSENLRNANKTLMNEQYDKVSNVIKIKDAFNVMKGGRDLYVEIEGDDLIITINHERIHDGQLRHMIADMEYDYSMQLIGDDKMLEKEVESRFPSNPVKLKGIPAPVVSYDYSLDAPSIYLQTIYRYTFKGRSMKKDEVEAIAETLALNLR